jgi:hypothetical protein
MAGCEWCGVEIAARPTGSRRRFCSDDHRYAHHRAARRAARTSSTVAKNGTPVSLPVAVQKAEPAVKQRERFLQTLDPEIRAWIEAGDLTIEEVAEIYVRAKAEVAAEKLYAGKR